MFLEIQTCLIEFDAQGETVTRSFRTENITQR